MRLTLLLESLLHILQRFISPLHPDQGGPEEAKAFRTLPCHVLHQNLASTAS